MYAEAPDYPQVVTAALKEMHRQTGDLEMDEDGIAMRGLLVRHLVLPEGLAGTREAMRFLAKEISGNTYVNIMDQYHPCGEIIPPASPLAGESRGRNSGKPLTWRGKKELPAWIKAEQGRIALPPRSVDRVKIRMGGKWRRERDSNPRYTFEGRTIA